ncbi:DMT family transporter [Candidatus Peregrinibacteria bacterium]|nr:DMT family transporter [Candidatus Peregrinibacteria bacterium]
MPSERKKLLRGYACGISAALLWGFHAVLIRVLIKQGVDPFLIGALRLFIGSTTLAVLVGGFSVLKRKKIPSIRYSKFFWFIAFSLAANFLLFHKGMEFTTASDAILLEAFSPVMGLVLAMVFFPLRIDYLMKHPGLPQKIILIIVLGSIGSAFILMNDAQNLFITNEAKFTGDMIEFAAMFAWALVMLSVHEYQKRDPNQNSLAVAAQYLFVGGVIMMPFVEWTQLAAITQTQWMWIFVLGVFSTGIAYFLWHIASNNLDVFPLMTIFNFVSVFNVTMETIVLGLKLSWKLLLGGLLVLYAAVKAEMINAKYKIGYTAEATTDPQKMPEK